MPEVAVCQICNQVEEWHEEHRPRHAFSPDSTRFRMAEPKKVTLTGDPVLRMVLVRKGLIEPEELTAVERELSSAGIATSHGMGESRSDPEPIEDRKRTGTEGGMRPRAAGSAASSGRAGEHKRKS